MTYHRYRNQSQIFYMNKILYSNAYIPRDPFFTKRINIRKLLNSLCSDINPYWYL